MKYAIAVCATALLVGAPAQSFAKGSKEHSKQQKASQSSQREELQGRVKETKDVRARGNNQNNQNKVALLETKDGRIIAVDLGPSAKLQNVRLESGTPLTVQGTVVNVKGEPVFIAERYSVGGKSAQVQRSSSSASSGSQAASSAGSQEPKITRVSGKIEKMRQVGVNNGSARHSVAIVQANKGRLYVDLGPTSQLEDLNLKVGDRVQVKGIAATAQDRRILIAQRVKANGQEASIDRNAVAVQPVRGTDDAMEQGDSQRARRQNSQQQNEKQDEQMEQMQEMESQERGTQQQP